MQYISTAGTFCYYDRVTYSWKIAETSMLFLLGFEAATTYNKSVSDSLTISNYVYYKDSGELTPLENFEVYDEIHNYLSSLGTVEDFDEYLKYNCRGLKLLLNDITGVTDGRTVPIIFKDDINSKKLTLNKVTVGLTDVKNTPYYNIQAQLIKNIFDYAGYNKESADTIYLADADITDESIRAYVKSNNASLNAEHQEKLFYSNIYCLLDYKAMYSYALGVLYGCRCIGYSDKYIWRYSPDVWYKGSFSNLVRTAWYTFKFRFSGNQSNIHSILKGDVNYQAIQPNKLWNFDDTEACVAATKFKNDEVDCLSVAIVDTDKLYANQIAYSKSTVVDTSSDYIGSYLDLDMLIKTDKIGWAGIGAKISSEEPLQGIISTNESPLVYYIGEFPIKLIQSYAFDDGKYLAPIGNVFDEKGERAYFRDNGDDKVFINNPIPPSILYTRDGDSFTQLKANSSKYYIITGYFTSDDREVKLPEYEKRFTLDSKQDYLTYIYSYDGSDAFSLSYITYITASL